MAQDRSKQSNIQRELVRAAIIKLRASGLEISPHTIAVEANIPRSTIYRNAELMDLINKEGGVKVESESPFTESAEERIAELQAHVQEQDQHIWDLEKENEDLHSEVENAWTMGFQAGLAEAARRHSEPESEPVTAETALSKATGEHPLFRITGTHAAVKRPSAEEMEAGGEITGDHQIFNPETSVNDGSVYHLDSDNREELGIKISISGGHQPLTPTDTQTKMAQAVPQQASVPVQDFQPTESSSAIQPLSAPTVPAPSRAQPHGVQAQSDIYNATRSGPYSNSVNPLVELSWKDLETVYNFRVESLMDYSRNIPSASSPARPPSGGNGAKPIVSDYIDPEILDMLPSEEEIGSLQNLEARVYNDGGDDGHTRHQRTLQEPQQEPYQEPAQEPHQEPQPELVPQDPPYEYYQQQDQQAAGNYRQADETGDRMDAMADPRLADGEHVIDLDSLDIFEDIDEYNFETLTGHAKKAADDHFEGKSDAGDELRNLIKGRIASASDLPYEPVPSSSKVSPKASSVNLDPITEVEASGLGGSRNKFIGGKGGAAPAPNKGSFVVKQIPPEIRKSSHILGLRPEELTRESTITNWKMLIASPGVHPDLGGDTESAVHLNIAKDTILKWLDQQAPKLGKKFGGHH